MTDRWAVVLALATAAGAWLSHAVPLWLGASVAGGLAFALRRPALLCLGAVLLASGLGARSWAGLVPPPFGPVRGVATLVADPVEVAGAIRVEVRLDGRRFEAWARDQAGARLHERLAGQRVELAGRTAPLGEYGAYLARRHVVARIVVAEVGAWSPGTGLARLANGLRRVLVDGAVSMPDAERALFTGLVLGDDRRQEPETVDDFRAAGLSHLLAVSGQNVAFVLALVAPLFALFGLRGRLIAGLVVLVVFGVVTRWEPSVLRAEAMAAVALVATTVGRPASTLRLLALAATGLLLVDPLLVGSLGFLLSCGACTGIAVLAPRLSRRMPLPVAVTLAAQVGVAPVLLPVFGGVPVASLPANLLAVPAAGPVVLWGLAAGLPAGLAGGVVATIIHLPTRLLVGWIGGVARWAAGIPLGELGLGHALVMGVLVAGAALAPRARATAIVAAVAVALAPAVAMARPSSLDGVELVQGARLWRAGRATVLVVDRPSISPLLGALREAGVRTVSVMVATSGRHGLASALEPVVRRHRPEAVLTPADNVGGTTVTAGRLRVDLVAAGPRLVAQVSRCDQVCPAPDR